MRARTSVNVSVQGPAVAVAALLVLLLSAAGGAEGHRRPGPSNETRLQSPAQGHTVAFATRVLPSRPTWLVLATDWWGGTYRTETGETVRIYLSDQYELDETRALRWVSFLAGLVHGRELSRLTMYVAPEALVSRVCGSGALGCYAVDDESITVIGDEIELPEPLTVEQVVAHEYGHHVANNRRNPPWSALEWGTKRWASLVRVCVRVREGSAGDRYDRHPAEAYAESYRVLIDRGRGVPFLWPIVDASFVPGPRALEAIRQDVLVPWSPTTTRSRGKVGTGHPARYTIPTPFDGTFTVRVSAPSARVEVIVTAAAGVILKRGTGRVTATICGQRRVRVVVRALSGSGPFKLVVVKP